MPDLKTVFCRRGPRSLPGGRILTQGGTARDVDTSDPQVADLLDQGHLEVVAAKPVRGHKPTTKKEEEAK